MVPVLHAFHAFHASLALDVSFMFSFVEIKFLEASGLKTLTFYRSKHGEIVQTLRFP
jgi:hypothetical protein